MPKDDLLTLDYEPLIFLRCHSKTDQDAADVRTQVQEYCYCFMFLIYDLTIHVTLGMAGGFQAKSIEYGSHLRWK